MDAPIREKMLRFQMSVPAEEKVLNFILNTNDMSRKTLLSFI
jgi:hypothetical protein